MTVETITYDSKSFQNKRSEKHLDYIKERLSDCIGKSDNLSVWIYKEQGQKRESELITCKVKLVSPAYGVIFVEKKGAHLSTVVHGVIQNVKRIHDKYKSKKKLNKNNVKILNFLKNFKYTNDGQEFDAV